MRTLIGFLVAGLAAFGAPAAQAADLDYGVLRGAEYDTPVQTVDWTGVYVGGHGGYTGTSVGFGNAGRSEIAQIVRGLRVEAEYGVSGSNRLRSKNGRGGSFGGFAGYNMQFDDTVVGIEVDYTSLNQSVASSDSLGRNVTLSNGLYDSFAIATRSSAKMIDYGTIRARGGFAFGPFMPFATAGIAFGRAEVRNQVQVSLREYTDNTRTTLVGALDQSGGGGAKEKYALGFAAGGGIDYAITSNVFLRAEYQYIQFADFGDQKVHLNTVRGALGVKF
ncbi:hypothetical protein ASG40_06115 [Methylobacterium sp. Leaf399]|uniref:outer membrane protein n=1 Tax=Methylobacterium sp. Leaf399 TaxID=1736364 RepID=UPI0006F89BA0|nr:outer membrane beta-barrel protein [Methylobacterium sp. Leaf399]KQT14871.1 hypothetical protein ASG40_06115 [Methylobacterium sp. Leaf399]